MNYAKKLRWLHVELSKFFSAQGDIEDQLRPNVAVRWYFTLDDLTLILYPKHAQALLDATHPRPNRLLGLTEALLLPSVFKSLCQRLKIKERARSVLPPREPFYVWVPVPLAKRLRLPILDNPPLYRYTEAQREYSYRPMAWGKAGGRKCGARA